MEKILRPKRMWQLIDLKELWEFHELFWVLAWKDFKVRYKQTAIGALWAVFQPLFSMFVFTIFFGSIAKIPSGELPYSLFVLVGLVFWTYFSSILNTSSISMVENENLIKKVYFPRIILPSSKILVSFVDFLIAFAMLIIISLVLGYIPHANILLVVPIGIIVATIGAIGIGLLLSAINVKYRDVRFALPFFIQMMIFFTPVIYPTNIVRPELTKIMALNPMTAVIESVRSTIAGSGNINWEIILISSLSSVALFVVGLAYFRATERIFADII